LEAAYGDRQDGCLTPHISSRKPTYLSFIHHNGSARYVRTEGKKALRIGDEVTLRLRTVIDAPIERLLLRTCPDGEHLQRNIYRTNPHRPRPLFSPSNDSHRSSDLTINALKKAGYDHQADPDLY
jgi:hypothetical protein